MATLKLPSGGGGGGVRLISKKCSATVRQVGNVGANRKKLGMARSKRWLDKRPVVRGIVMNPVTIHMGVVKGGPVEEKKIEGCCNTFTKKILL
ncbi:putative ribosomal protein L2 [Helianthus anomalus]